MSSFTTWRCDGPKCGREVRAVVYPPSWRSVEWGSDFCSRQCMKDFLESYDFAPSPNIDEAPFPDQPEESR